LDKLVVRKREVEVGDDDDKAAMIGGLFIPKYA